MANMTPEQNEMIIEMNVNIKSILGFITEIKKDVEALQLESRTIKDDVIENKMNISFMEKRISDNYKNQRSDIDGAFSKISRCSDAKEKFIKADHEAIEQYINDKIKLSSSSLQIKFYIAMIAALSSFLIPLLKDLLKK